MTIKRYDIFLDGKLIGTTELEKADAPMGVVFGNVAFDNIISGYDFLKTYCSNNSIEIINDYPAEKLIATSDIPNLKVIDPSGIEIKGQGANINGRDDDVFEITILGIPYPFFEEAFPHHVKSSNDQFNKNESDSSPIRGSFCVSSTTPKTMNNEKTFKTKTGYCHILPDKIVLTRDGIVGEVAKVTVGSNISRILTIYGVLSIGLLYSAFDSYKEGQLVSSIFFGLFGLFLVYGIAKSINNSATPIIERQKIKAVVLKKAIVGVTRSRFEVLFEDEQGKIKKRLIMLPGSLTGGQNETEKAIRIMTDEKLISNS